MKGNNGRAARRLLLRRLAIVLGCFAGVFFFLHALGIDDTDEPSKNSNEEIDGPEVWTKSLLRKKGRDDKKHGKRVPPPGDNHRTIDIDLSDAKASKKNADAIQGILDAKIHLVNIQKESVSFFGGKSDNFLDSIVGEFCSLDFSQHKQDPSSIPMFRDLVQHSEECSRIRYHVKLQPLLTRMYDYEIDKQKLTPKSLSLKGVVFHESRCGSTLVANSLMAMDPAHHRVYSESAPPIAALKSICGDYYDSCTQSQAADLLKHVVYLMGRSDDPNEMNVFFKIQSIGTRNIAVFQEAFPTTPWIFVYREPVQVMMSHLSKGHAKNANCVRPRHFPPRIVTNIVQRASTTVTALSDEQYCAAHLASITESAVSAMGRSELGAAVNYADLPSVLYEHILPRHFGLEVTETAKENILKVSQKYSKGRDGRKKEWQEDSERKDELATPEIRKAAALFLQESYETLSQTREEQGSR